MRRFEQDQNMPRWFGRDQFLGHFVAERPEQIEVVDEKRQMDVVGNRIERDDFDREKPPIFEKPAQAGKRQSTFAQPSHELAAMDGLVPVGMDVVIEVVDDCFGLRGFHGGWEMARLGASYKLLPWSDFLYC